MIHKYCLNGIYVAVDANSGSVHIIDKIVYDILDFLEPPLTKEMPQELILNLDYPLQEIKEAYNEIVKLYETNTLFSKEVKPNVSFSANEAIPIKSACLHISHDCNLRCRYCFASTGNFGGRRENMPLEVGKRAINFLIKRSLNRKNLEVDFFGGEPLLNFEVVEGIVDYARSLEQQNNKKFRFTITTNGINLDSHKIDFINKEMSNVVLSIDGRKAVNDYMRITPNGSGTYDIILPKFKELVTKRGFKNYYVRGTFTKNNLDFTNDVLHLADLGFDQISIEPAALDQHLPYAIDEASLARICSEYETLMNKIIERAKQKKYFNFFHFSVNSQHAPCLSKRIKGCGAGTEYIAVTPSGDIYPCHQFVGVPEYIMGNVIDGTFQTDKQAQFANVNIYSKIGCNECWAKYYCSGGCNANNFKFEHNMLQPYKINCHLQKKRLECAFVLHAILNSEQSIPA